MLTSNSLNLMLPSLKSLEIGFSETIKFIVVGNDNLPSLGGLVIKGCKNLSCCSGIGDLSVLRELQLDGCPYLLLHEDIPPSLQVLKITNCPGLCNWELSQRIAFGHKLQGRGTYGDDHLEAFEDEDFSFWKDDNNAYEEAITLNSIYEMNYEVPSSIVSISWDEYSLDNWLLSLSQKSQQYSDKDQLPSCSRKDFHNESKKEINTILDKGKGLLTEKNYSSGIREKDYSCSRKGFRNALKKTTNTISDKVKGLLLTEKNYSSGIRENDYSCSRKGFRNALKKETNTISDKGKGLPLTEKNYSSGIRENDYSCSRNGFHNALKKEIDTISDKGKGLLWTEKNYSSGSSIGHASDSELESFGSTSEDDFGL